MKLTWSLVLIEGVKEMIFLYVAPRFHPNQYPILEGLILKGHDVHFLATKIGATEEHGNVHVKILKANKLTRTMAKVWEKKGSNYVENKLVFWFCPDRIDLINTIKSIKPDVVILRDRNILSLVTKNICKKLGISKILLYNQGPIYTKKDKWHKDMMRKIWFAFFPKTRITVCRYMSYPFSKDNYTCDNNAFFMPHVPRIRNYVDREYLKNGRVNIFDCGKYRDYKNHLLLIEAVKILADKGYTDFHVTILGQAVNPDEKDYYDKCAEMIKSLSLEKYIDLETEVPYEKIPEYYLLNFPITKRPRKRKAA